MPDHDGLGPGKRFKGRGRGNCISKDISLANTVVGFGKLLLASGVIKLIAIPIARKLLPSLGKRRIKGCKEKMLKGKEEDRILKKAVEAEWEEIP